MINSLSTNIDITKLSNFKTPAKANYYFEINIETDILKLGEIFDFIKEHKLKYLFLGSGTNILFAFDIFDGVVIKNNLLGWSYNSDTKILDSMSSENISDISEELENKFNQSLWHRFIGLPGSVGGAVVGNAGCFGLEIENNFKDITVYDIDKKDVRQLSKVDMDFSYRSSILKASNKYFLISARFDLSKKIEKYHSDQDNIYFRKHMQPDGNTCGSFFKNPSKEFSAGKLIEEVGLKGYKLGGAYFSDLHANFLMNSNAGNYIDLLDLISLAQKKVNKQFNIDLVPEVRIIKN